MNKLLVFISAILLAFISCDGRHRAYQSNQDILKEHKLYKSFSENVKYLPETYSEIITDTILSNGFNVKIKTYTDMEHSYLSEFTKDTIQYKNYYRDIKTSVNISKGNQVITSKLITKDLFIDYDNSYSKSLKNEIIQEVWLNQYASIKNNSVILNVLFHKPNSKDYIYYTLTFMDNGEYSIKNELEQNVI